MKHSLAQRNSLRVLPIRPPYTNLGAVFMQCYTYVHFDAGLKLQQTKAQITLCQLTCDGDFDGRDFFIPVAFLGVRPLVLIGHLTERHEKSTSTHCGLESLVHREQVFLLLTADRQLVLCDLHPQEPV